MTDPSPDPSPDTPPVEPSSTEPPSEPPTPGPDALQAERWIRAEAHSLAAASLLDDPSVPPWTAAEHLRRGFLALAQAAGLEPSRLDQLDVSALPWLGSPQAVDEALQVLATDDDAALDPTPLRLLGAALAAAVRTAQDERFAPARRQERRRQALRRAAMALLVLLPVVAVLLLTLPDYREGPWRAELYVTKDFSGEPMLRRDGDLKFDWRRRPPHPDLPEDGFSIRWDTCMELAEPLDVSFQLISDDGSRLMIDGEPVVDNWGRHGERSRGAEVSLTAGIHHLRVEYYEERHTAMVELRVSLHGEVPDSLPVRLLHYPGEQIDPADPCAAVREP